MTAKEALEILKSKNTTLKLNHKIGNRDIAINEVKGITKGIDSILPIIEQALTELEELKKKVVKYVNLSKYAVSGDLEDNEFLKFWELGEKLCKGSEER